MSFFSKKTLRFRLWPGNVLTEYGVVGSLILLVCIAAFLVVGDNLHQIFSDFKSDMNTQNKAAVAATIIAERPEINLPPLSDKQIEALLEELTDEERDLLQRDLKARVQTTGADGSTRILAKQLAQLTKQWLSEGKINAEQGDTLMLMANQGYRIAEIERIVEDAVRTSGGDKKKLESMRFNQEGQSYTLMGLASQIGFNDHASSKNPSKNMLENIDTAQYHLQNLLSLYKQIDETGILANPEIKASVTNITTEIASTGDSVDNTLYSAIKKNTPITDVNDFRNQLGSNISI